MALYKRVVLLAVPVVMLFIVMAPGPSGDMDTRPVRVYPDASARQGKNESTGAGKAAQQRRVLGKPGSANDDAHAAALKHKYDALFEEYPFLLYTEEVEAAAAQLNEQYYWPRWRRAYGALDGAEIGGVEGLHMYYTTDCKKHALWQALALEDSWARVRQPGALTRVVSGCHEPKGVVPSPNIEMLTRQIVDHERLFVFFTPTWGGRGGGRPLDKCSPEVDGWYSEVGSPMFMAAIDGGSDACRAKCAAMGECHRWNYRKSDSNCHMFSGPEEGKAGTHHMDTYHVTGSCPALSKDQQRYLTPDYIGSYSPMNRPFASMFWFAKAAIQERVLCLVDPDFIFMQPWHFHIEPETVADGVPVSQFYKYMDSDQWIKNYGNMCRKDEPGACPPVRKAWDYALGPPIMMTRRDWQRVGPFWIAYTVEHRRLTESWISEMFAMSSAMARYDLRSKYVQNAMWDGFSPKSTSLLQVALAKETVASGWRLCAHDKEPCRLPPGEREYEVRYGRPPFTDGAGDPRRVKVPAEEGVAFMCSREAGGLFAGTRGFWDSVGWQLLRDEVDHSKGCFIRETSGDATPMPDRAGWIYCADKGTACRLPFHEGATQYTIRYGDGPWWGYTESTAAAGATFTCGGDGAARATMADTTRINPQCYYKPVYARGLEVAPPVLTDYVPASGLPQAFHYCRTYETSRQGWPEDFWNSDGAVMREWEVQHQEPLLTYMHLAKFRMFTDWGGVAEPTMLECDRPILFDFPPLPEALDDSLAPSFDHKESQIFYSVIVTGVNTALTKYKLKYCPRVAPDGGSAPVNLVRHGRTSHKKNWLSLFRTIYQPEVPYYRFVRVE